MNMQEQIQARIDELKQQGNKIMMTVNELNDASIKPWDVTDDIVLWNYEIFSKMHRDRENALWFNRNDNGDIIINQQNFEKQYCELTFEQRFGLCNRIEYPVPLNKRHSRNILRRLYTEFPIMTLARRSNETWQLGTYGLSMGPPRQIPIWTPRVFPHQNEYLPLMKINGDHTTYLQHLLTHCYHKPYLRHHNITYPQRHYNLDDRSMFEQWTELVNDNKTVTMSQVIETTRKANNHEVNDPDDDLNGNGVRLGRAWNRYERKLKDKMIARYEHTRMETLHNDMKHMSIHDDLITDARKQLTDAHQIYRETHTDHVARMRNESLRIINHFQKFLTSRDDYSPHEALQNNSFFSFLKDAFAIGEKPEGAIPNFMMMWTKVQQEFARAQLFERRLRLVELLRGLWMRQENQNGLFIEHRVKTRVKSSTLPDNYNPIQGAPVIDEWVRSFVYDQSAYERTQHDIAEHLNTDLSDIQGRLYDASVNANRYDHLPANLDDMDLSRILSLRMFYRAREIRLASDDENWQHWKWLENHFNTMMMYSTQSQFAKQKHLSLSDPNNTINHYSMRMNKPASANLDALNARIRLEPILHRRDPFIKLGDYEDVLDPQGDGIVRHPLCPETKKRNRMDESYLNDNPKAHPVYSIVGRDYVHTGPYGQYTTTTREFLSPDPESIRAIPYRNSLTIFEIATKLKKEELDSHRNANYLLSGAELSGLHLDFKYINRAFYFKQGPRTWRMGHALRKVNWDYSRLQVAVYPIESALQISKLIVSRDLVVKDDRPAPVNPHPIQAPPVSLSDDDDENFSPISPTSDASSISHASTSFSPPSPTYSPASPDEAKAEQADEEEKEVDGPFDGLPPQRPYLSLVVED